MIFQGWRIITINHMMIYPHLENWQWNQHDSRESRGMIPVAGEIIGGIIT